MIHNPSWVETAEEIVPVTNVGLLFSILLNATTPPTLTQTMITMQILDNSQVLKIVLFLLSSMQTMTNYVLGFRRS